MPFFMFSQNNSVGELIRDDDVCEFVIIEAPTATDDNDKAESVGLYFDGLGDCQCCGNRWYKVDDSDSNEEPMIYAEPLDRAGRTLFRRFAILYRADGTKTLVPLLDSDD